MYSIQTNVTSQFAQNNLRVNSEFQSQTISRLTSGYRINKSGDDAAGLAVANGLRSSVAELNQGVRNANDGLSALQIIDGGLNNISKILDRQKTLATQSASGTFTGSRSTLEQEFSTLQAEIDRQAANINLNAGGTYNKNVSVYIGGGSGSNTKVSFDLSGVGGRADSVSLGIAASTTIDSGLVGSTIANNTVNTLGSSSATFLSGSSATGATQTFDVTVGGKTLTKIDVVGSQSGITGQQAVDQLNTKLTQFGITASINSSGSLQFNGSNSFVVSANTALTGAGATGAIATPDASTHLNYATNTAQYNNTQAFSTVAGASQALAFTVGGKTTTVTLNIGDTLATAVQSINSALNSQGVNAIGTSDGKLSLQSAGQFNLSVTGASTTAGLGGGSPATGAQTITAPDATIQADPTLQAQSALTAINNAISNLGKVQGTVGAAENQLGYAVNLAQSQITNFSSAESQIRDADVAAEAANLTKAQVLQQASLAALAQANSAPQAVLKLLQG